MCIRDSLLHLLVTGSLVHVGAFDFFVGGKNLILGRFFSLLGFLVLIVVIIGAFGCRCSFPSLIKKMADEWKKL